MSFRARTNHLPRIPKWSVQPPNTPPACPVVHRLPLFSWIRSFGYCLGSLYLILLPSAFRSLLKGHYVRQFFPDRLHKSSPAVSPIPRMYAFMSFSVLCSFFPLFFLSLLPSLFIFMVLISSWGFTCSWWTALRHIKGQYLLIAQSKLMTSTMTRQNLTYNSITIFILRISYLPSVQFSHSVVSKSLRPHGLQHIRLPCPSPTPRVYSNSCPSSQWCHPSISSSVVPFSCLQSFPASGSFLMSQFSTSGGQVIGALASASVPPINIQNRFSLGLTGLIFLLSRGLSRVFSDTTVQKHQFFDAQLSL